MLECMSDRSAAQVRKGGQGRQADFGAFRRIHAVSAKREQSVATQEETFFAEASVYACVLYARHIPEIFSGGKVGMT
jgi:hypothetical protein